MNIAAYNKIKSMGEYLLLLALLFSLVYEIYQSWLLMNPIKPKAISTHFTKPAELPQIDLGILARVPFLGIANTEEVESIYQSSALELQGIFWSADAANAHAILQTETDRARVYTAGDAIMPGVIITKILQDRILLSRNGRKETLLLNPKEPT